MAKEKITDIECMLVAIYKKLDDIERNLNGSSRSAPMSSYYDDLKKAAQKVKESLESRNNE